MSKNYKYCYNTNILPPSPGPINGIEYETDYNQGSESDEYYEETYDPKNRQINYADCIKENVPTANTKIQPPSAASPTQTVPKVSSKLPYCIVPVLYVPKRIVQKEEIARNRVLQNSLASLSRMENLFYKYKESYENDAGNPAAPQVDLPLHQNDKVQDYSVPNAYTDNSYYDSQYEYCTSNTNYEDDYTIPRKQRNEPVQDYKYESVPPKVQTSIPNYNYIYNYDREIANPYTETTYCDKQLNNIHQYTRDDWLPRRSNLYMDTISYCDKQPNNIHQCTRDDYLTRRSNLYVDTYCDKQPNNNIHQYTRDDWFACQGRRFPNNIPINYNVTRPQGKFSKNLKNIETNTTPRLASMHSIGISAIAEHDSKISQTLGTLPGYGEKRSIFCESSTQTEPQNYVDSIRQRLTSPSRHGETKSIFCEGSNAMLQSNPTRSATLIPKLKPISPPCNTTESSKSCIHERNAYDSRQRNSGLKPLRPMNSEAARNIWK